MMLSSITPLRISFLGGGTDFPWFFEEHSGGVISTAIDKYIYISGIPSFDRRTTYLKYSSYERVASNQEVQHPIFRAILNTYDLPPFDFAVMSDIPGGTGLGSSSAFTVGLLNFVSSFLKLSPDSETLARTAIDIELNQLSEPIGVQDHLPAAFGGFAHYRFAKSSSFERFDLSTEALKQFELILVPTGARQRQASALTSAQKDYVSRNANGMSALQELAALTDEAGKALIKKPELLPKYVSKGWELKKATNPSSSNEAVDLIIREGSARGSLAGKLLGAGGSGFVLLMFDSGETTKFRSFANEVGWRVVDVSPTPRGSHVQQVN